MKLILNCDSSNENFSGGCDYILVDLYPALARLALSRIDMVNVMRKADDELWSANFWNYSPEWFSPYPENFDGEQPSDDEKERIAELVEGADPGCYKIVADDVTIPPAFHARTECNFMVVSDDDIHWECYPKHCDITITSARIPIDVLREAVKAVEVNP